MIITESVRFLVICGNIFIMGGIVINVLNIKKNKLLNYVPHSYYIYYDYIRGKNRIYPYPLNLI